MTFKLFFISINHFLNAKISHAIIIPIPPKGGKMLDNVFSSVKARWYNDPEKQIIEN